jgi:mono/diheme cytochrome c family protein
MRGLLIWAVGALAVAVTTAGPVRAAASVQPATGQSDTSERALLDRYCVTCHNQRQQVAGLALDTVDVTDVAAHPAIWEKVVRKLRAGAMPPAPRPRPDAAIYESFTTWLESELDAAAAAHPDPGRTDTFHRLNRSEYQNVVRDLLALDVDVRELLPADDGSYGFDNIAGVLGISPTLLERYLSAAKKISRLAVGRPAPSATASTFRLATDLTQDDHADGLPFGTRGGTRFDFTFPEDAEYAFRVKLGRDASGTLKIFDTPHRLEVSLDGEPLQTFVVGEVPPEGVERSSPEYRAYLTRQRAIDDEWEVRAPVRAGPHTVQVTFYQKTTAYAETLRRPFLRPYTSITGGDTRYQPYVGSVTVAGPFEGSGRRPVDETPSRQRIFSCHTAPGRSGVNAADSSASSDAARCAREILSTLARRAYRRPVTERDLDVLLGFYDQGHTDGGFEAGIELALRRLLASPEFLFRVERDPQDVEPGTPYRVSDLELASRLSFFLWSSIPDDELLDVAIAGTLHQPSVLEAQTRRMLADSRAAALVENFAGQWLYLRNVRALTPDENLFPDFGESLRVAFQRETELFFESVLHDDRSVLEFLTADYTFLNERLARHYGIPNIYGSHFRRVTLPDPTRRGLLGHGSILAATAYPNRTSPVLRGKWVLENLLGTPPPLPPPNVPSLEETTADGSALSMREAMERHRANPVCASCHRLMDPPGFALEQFDAVGRYRTRNESNMPIDASGVLPDGTVFDGAAGLRAALMARPNLFVTTLTEKLLTYALGRGVEYHDAPAIRAIRRESAAEGYRFSSLILGVIESPPFQMRRSLGTDHDH